MSQVVSIEWLTSHLTIYADDFHIAATVRCWDDVRHLFRAIGHLVSILNSLGMTVSAAKSSVLMKLQGKHVRKFQARFIRKTAKGQLLCIDSPWDPWNSP